MSLIEVTASKEELNKRIDAVETLMVSIVDSNKKLSERLDQILTLMMSSDTARSVTSIKTPVAAAAISPPVSAEEMR